MTLARLCLLALAVTITLPNVVQAESRWSLKKLVPSFSKKESKPRPKKSGPSTLSKINNGTKALLAKSKAIVPSWLMPKTQERVRKSSDNARKSAGRIGTEVRTARRNILMPWLEPEEPEKPTTVSDFLALPKPGY